MSEVGVYSDDVASLRRCVRDLAALSALPALWAGSDALRIVESLAEALLGLLRLEFIYIQVQGRDGAIEIEVGRVAGRPSAASEARVLGEVLAPWLASGTPMSNSVSLPWVDKAVRTAIIPFGADGADGAGGRLVAGKQHDHFPGETDRLLLRVGGNQAAVLLARLRSETEMARLLETEKRRTVLLARVAQASRCINAVLSVESITAILKEEARALLGARVAKVSLTLDEDSGEPARSASRSKTSRTDGASGELGAPDAEDLEGRRTLTAPLIGARGRELGLIELAEKFEGGFTAEDDAVLLQLASIAAIGIENARLYASLREQDQRKDEFLATLAHELRNPLAPVRNGLEILRMTGDPSGPSARTRAMMGRQISHMVRLVDDLMDVSRVSRGKITLVPKLIRLQTVIDAALETSRPLIETAGHSLELVLNDAHLYVRGDLTRLAQVLSNLLNNAAKYTPDGGWIRLSVAREQEHVVIRVQDGGVGIPADMLKKVFDLFTQVGRSIDRAQGGLGIGLSLAKRLVDMHGGSLTALSEGLGTGATFVVRLPLAVDMPAQAELHREHEAATSDVDSGLSILVVDDNVDAAESLAMLLQLSGHRTRTLYSGSGVLDVAAEYRPHAIFLDIGLPGLNGYDVVAQLRERPQLAPTIIVALTGWGSEEDRKRSRAAGFDAHLTKPVDMAALAEILEGLRQPTSALPQDG